MGFLDVTEVGKSAYLFMLNCNTQHSECAGGKGEEGKEGERSMSACRSTARGSTEKQSRQTAEMQSEAAMHRHRRRQGLDATGHRLSMETARGC